MWRAVAWVVAGLVIAQAGGAQKPIRVDVNLVNVGFTARNAQGALVDNLTKNDVELYEDAVQQKIEFFSKSTDLPLTLALIVDVSGSQDHFGKKHEKDLQVFLNEVVGPKDRVFLVCFGNHLRLVSDYTNSVRSDSRKLPGVRQGKEAFSGNWTAGRTGSGNSVLRFDLLQRGGKALARRRPQGNPDVQRRRRQFEFPQHDGHD